MENQSVIVLDSDSITMEFFRRFLSAIGVISTPSPQVDIITNLPVEIAQHILRMLDTDSLLNATNVSRSWLTICTGDFQLRQSARRQLRNQRQQLRNMDMTRQSKKAHQSCDIKVMQISLKTRRTYDNPLLHTKHFHISTFRQTIQTNSLSKKCSITSRNIGMTRILRLLR